MRDMKGQMLVMPCIGMMFILVLFGCATDRRIEPVPELTPLETERLLVKAGFKKKPAQTPEELAHLRTLPQRTVVPRVQDKILHYAYADATHCECLYTGPGEAYQRFKDLLAEARTTERERKAKMWYEIWGR